MGVEKGFGQRGTDFHSYHALSGTQSGFKSPDYAGEFINRDRQNYCEDVAHVRQEPYTADSFPLPDTEIRLELNGDRGVFTRSVVQEETFEMYPTSEGLVFSYSGPGNLAKRTFSRRFYSNQCGKPCPVLNELITMAEECDPSGVFNASRVVSEDDLYVLAEHVRGTPAGNMLFRDPGSYSFDQTNMSSLPAFPHYLGKDFGNDVLGE